MESDTQNSLSLSKTGNNIFSRNFKELDLSHSHKYVKNMVFEVFVYLIIEVDPILSVYDRKLDTVGILSKVEPIFSILPKMTPTKPTIHLLLPISCYSTHFIRFVFRF